jgi:hypothetical protein
MCESLGSSSYEEVLYELCVEQSLIKLFAAEAYCLHGRQPLRLGHNDWVHPSRKPWDVVVADPHGLLIEMHGEGHSSKVLTKSNNKDTSISDQQNRDLANAQEAVKQGWSVLWLWVDGWRVEPHSRRAAWKQQLRLAMEHVGGGGEAQHFGK